MKSIEGFEGLYSVDEHGNVFSHCKNIAVGKNGGVRKQPFKKLNLYEMKGGHKRVYLAKGGKKYPRLVHRLVAQAYIDNPNGYPIINHIDGDPKNNCASNLEWCSFKHNAKHATDLGLNVAPKQSGQFNSNSKFNEKLVLEIREKNKNGISISQLASLFNVGYSCIYNIVTYRNWKHI